MTNRIASKVKSQATTVSASTATKIPTTSTTGAISMVIKNNGSSILYLGGSDVSASNGYPVGPGGEFPIDIDANCPIYGLSASGNLDVRTLEGV